MCGIAGELSPNVQITTMRVLMDLMERRGPDDEGLWTDESCCALVFKRLSILDLSPSGHQPMLSLDGNNVLVFNGEIYNYQDIRSDLEKLGVQFRSSGDTEVVLNALKIWGINALNRFNGMFALAFYDVVAQSLILARDSSGIKPLYYLSTKDTFVFASQFNQLLAHPVAQTFDLDLTAFSQYLRVGYIPAPRTLLLNVFALEPGTWLEIDLQGNQKLGRFFEFSKYSEPDLIGDEAVDAIESALTSAVKRHLISDVPVGIFLSSGVDSSLVAAITSKVTNGALDAFTIGITDYGNLNESKDASNIARQLRLNHHIYNVSSHELPNLLPDIILSLSEPNADHSIIPTFIVSKLASQHVKVVLSGDGGDELFWGYVKRFGSTISNSDHYKHPYLLRLARHTLYKLIGIQHITYDTRWKTIGERYLLAHSYSTEKKLGELFPELNDRMKQAFNPSVSPLFDYSSSDVNQTAQWTRWNEFTGHLSRVLQKVDRASMFHSLEVRVPLLDREVIDVALRIDWRSCLNPSDNLGKIPLRKILQKHVSNQVIEKRGFGTPIGNWLRKDLRGILEETLLHRNTILGVPVNSTVLTKMVNQHIQGSVENPNTLWMLLSLCLWQDTHFKHYTEDR